MTSSWMMSAIFAPARAGKNQDHYAGIIPSSLPRAGTVHTPLPEL
jgi:hypothetical protein